MTAKMTGKPSSKKASSLRAEESEDALLVPLVLPRGLNSLPRDIVLMSQRSRLVEAIAHFVGTKGYPNTSVADIIARAGVSRTTFYQQFKDKEDCYLSCYERLSQSHLKRVVAAMAAQKSLKDGLIASIGAYLEHLAEDGGYALAFFAEATNAGERVRARESELKAASAERLRNWHDEVRAQYPKSLNPPPEMFDLIIDGSNAFLVRWVREGFQTDVQQVQRTICYYFFASLGLNKWAKEMLE
ncbi:TetR/AcrR family transcriptional regulator [Pseudomonas gingeri]